MAATTLVLLLIFAAAPALSWRPIFNNTTKPNSTDSLYRQSKKYEGSSELVEMKYHMGPVLSPNITVHPIWYGTWPELHKSIIRDFIRSISDPNPAHPSVAGWWETASLYSDQTGANVTRTVTLGAEMADPNCTHGKSLTRLSIQRVIETAASGHLRRIDARGGVFLVLTSEDVYVQDFCRAVCGFHYFTFPSVTGYTLPYAWVGNSGTVCPEVCAYPFAVPGYMTGVKALTAPNGVVGVDGMVTVIAHELAEVATNPLANAWFAGEDPSFPTEIADLCEGIYGSGGGGSYTGQLSTDVDGATYNLNGAGGRRFLVQWLWSNIFSYCTGPNAIDHH